MFKFLTKSRKGFTLVELMVVLVLLSFGVLALANMFRVTYRAFEKSEERSIKQEAVKNVAELLRSGSANVSAAQTADVFNTLDVVPAGSATDESYSYLFVDPHKICAGCSAEWDVVNDVCSESCGSTDSTIDGSYLYVLNKGSKRENAIQLSDVPIYVEMYIYEDESYAGGAVENQCGIVIELSALENDYDYDSGKPPISDDKYYTLDVAYHFPNMVTSDTGGTVNYISKDILSSANTYDAAGNVKEPVYAAECCTVDSNGKITYLPCSPEHCGCDPNVAVIVEDDAIEPVQHTNCADCDCKCPNKNATVLRIYADSILSGDDTNTSVAVPRLCFIATASYGHDSGEVGLLCNFRDKCLLTNPLGTAFVNAYYKLSPPIADFIAESEPLKAAVRLALKPLVAVATNALDHEAAQENAVWLAIFAACGAGTAVTLVRVSKRKNKVKE